MKPGIINSRHTQLALERRRRQQAALGHIGTCRVCGRTYPTSCTYVWGAARSSGVCSFTCHEQQRAAAAKQGVA